MANSIALQKIKVALEGESGNFTGLRFHADELTRIRALITTQWLQHISATAPEVVMQFESIGINRYHELCHLVDHESLWPKNRRILGPAAVIEIRGMSLVRALEEEFGRFEISDEDNVGHEEVYWRIVRPNSPTDIGPLHADAWFWNLGHGVTPSGYQRVKIWVAIYCDPGQNGLRIVPGSHKHDWPYHGENKHGMVKPQIDISDDELNIVIFDSQPGDAIVFHDRLLHGGAPGGTSTRVSMEFTMFVKNENYFV